MRIVKSPNLRPSTSYNRIMSSEREHFCDTASMTATTGGAHWWRSVSRKRRLHRLALAFLFGFCSHTLVRTVACRLMVYRAAKLRLFNFLSLFRDLQKPTRFSGGGGSSRIFP